jgi:hypothetical protein
MNAKQRSLAKIASAIRACIAESQRQPSGADKLPVDDWKDMTRIKRRIEIAERRGWRRAALRLSTSLNSEAEYFERQFSLWLDRRRQASKPRPLPKESELFRDLLALEQEFSEVTFNPDGAKISAVTEPITLEQRYLGPFRIELNCLDTVAFKPYRIVALEPNPASRDDSTTHPHVRDEALCEGQGQRAIQAALRDWRLLDFFVVIRQILLTYSEGNAFVELTDWDGVRCRDCGDSMDIDDYLSCGNCACQLCSNCFTCCGACGNDYCSECSTTCDHCDESSCRSCLTICRECRASVCRGCLEEDSDNLCERCHERAREQEEADATYEAEGQHAEAGGADAAIQSDCLGKTLVPA